MIARLPFVIAASLFLSPTQTYADITQEEVGTLSAGLLALAFEEITRERYRFMKAKPIGQLDPDVYAGANQAYQMMNVTFADHSRIVHEPLFGR